MEEFKNLEILINSGSLNADVKILETKIDDNKEK